MNDERKELIAKYQSISDLLMALGYSWDDTDMSFKREEITIPFHRISTRTVDSFVNAATDEELAAPKNEASELGSELATLYSLGYV